MQQGPSSRSIVYIVVNTPHGEDVGSELLRLVLGSGGLAHVEITDNPGKNLCLVMGNDGSTHVMTNALAVSRLLLERAGLGGLFVDRLAEATRRVILRERQLSVLARIARLEGGSAATATLGPWNYSDQTERVKRALEAARVKYRAVRTHADYYETPLAGRARFVGAKSEQNMLKMVLLKNDRDECFEPNALAVLVQYASSGFDTKTINVWFRETYKRSKSKVNFRVDPDGEAKTGFKRNGLSPFGSALACPLILDSCIAGRLGDDPVVWLGGGEFDVKIGVTLQDVLAALKPVQLSLTP